jgi:hypothetical protein
MKLVPSLVARMSAERLKPVIVEQRAKQQAFVLIHRGYVQAMETVDCPVCSLRFLLLFDSKDRNVQGRKSSAIHQKAVHYFLAKVRKDHESGHPHHKFTMPGFIHRRNERTNRVESFCVFCENKIGASRERPRLIAAERSHNCSLSAFKPRH